MNVFCLTSWHHGNRDAEKAINRFVWAVNFLVFGFAAKVVFAAVREAD